MGLFNTACLIENQQDRSKKIRIPKLLVDTGSELTWISQKFLEKIGIEQEKKNMRFIMANGQEITRSIGFAIIRVGKEFTTDEVVFPKRVIFNYWGSDLFKGLI